MCYAMISRYIIIQTGELKMQKKTLGQYRFTPKLIRPFAIDEKTFQECLSALSNEKAYVSSDEQFVGIMKMYYAQLNTVKNSVELLEMYKEIKWMIKNVSGSFQAMQYVMQQEDERIEEACKLHIQMATQLSALYIVKYALQTIILEGE